jgi:two-component system chemotaxis response regulator CheB
MPGHDIIVIGASVGGVEALSTIVGGLSADLPASVFVVLHISPRGPSMLPGILQNAGRLPVAHGDDGEPIVPGRIYVARPDYHLMVESGRVRVTRGPKENSSRPALDPLFRSAARAYGPRVVGVVLTGNLDDGAAGLWAIKVRGGTAIVQEPEEARAPSMPLSALRHTQVDYCLRLAEIPPILARLAASPAAEADRFPVPQWLDVETKIALEAKALDVGLAKLGEPSLFTCPECHGMLLRLRHGGPMRYRCHTGHAFTAASLLADLSESVEDSLWNAVRSIEESSLLMQHIAVHVGEAGDAHLAEEYRRRAEEAARRAEVVRRVVLQHKTVSPELLAEESA